MIMNMSTKRIICILCHRALLSMAMAVVSSATRDDALEEGWRSFHGGSILGAEQDSAVNILMLAINDGTSSLRRSQRRQGPRKMNLFHSLLQHPWRSRDHLFDSMDDGWGQRMTSFFKDIKLASAGEEQYVRRCKRYLLSPQSTEDEILSQINYTDMLVDQCRLNDQCLLPIAVTFDQLDVALQMAFIDGLCPSATLTNDDRFECISNLYEMWLDGGVFGFHADDPDIGDLVSNMCVSTYPAAVNSGIAKSVGE